jgi:hypothetical protein
MKKRLTLLKMTGVSLCLFILVGLAGCYKDLPDEGVNTAPYYNLDVKLLPAFSKAGFGENGAGFIKFRQDPDTARIINLDTYLFHLQPHHSYLLQRAVDPISSSTCMSTAWLTLGLGLVPQAIVTDDKGNGHEDLFRNVSSVARGTQFRIHFQIIDAVTSETVLTSDCTQYTVR